MSINPTVTLMDRAIGFFSPERALHRVHNRAKLSMITGGYHGASSRRTFGKGWNANKGDSDSTDLKALPSLRARSRDLERNSDIAHGIIGTDVTNTVGSGLIPSSDIDHELLGMSEEEATEWEVHNDREFRLWAESKDCDATRTSDFYTLTDIAYRTELVGGDVIALLPHIKRPGNPYGTAIRLLEGDHLVNERAVKDSTHLAGGIRTDANGAPIEYHILKSHPGSTAKRKEWIKIRAFSPTGRPNLIHLFAKKRPGQRRGIPALAPIIESLKQLSNYTEAELTAAVVSGMLTVFVTQDGALGDGLPDDGAGESEESYDYKLGNGAIVGMAPGEKTEVVNPGRPNPNFAPFEEAIIRHIGAAMEIPFEIILKHFTASYSASRAAMNEAWKYFRTKRAKLVRDFTAPIRARWMDEAVAIGRIDAPGYFDDPLIRKAWQGCVWNGPVPGQINEVAETKAAVARIEHHISNTEREAQQINGTDARTNVKKNKQFKKLTGEDNAPK